MNVFAYDQLEDLDFDPKVEAPNSISGLNHEEFIVDNKKIFACMHPNCGKKFKFQSEINRHLIIHFSQRPFTCSVPGCQKSFKRAYALTNHVRTHKKVTSFFCTVEGCASKFTTKSALKYHLLRHSGGGLFRCDYPGCKGAFITHAGLKQHTNASFCHKRVKNTTSEGSSELSQNDQYDTLSSIRDNPIYDDTRGGSMYDASYPNNQPTKVICPEGNFIKVLPSLDITRQGSGCNERDKFETDETSTSDLSCTSRKMDASQNSNPLVTLLSMVMKENRELKNILQEALDMLQVYRQKEQKKDVDLFFKSTSDAEGKNEKSFFINFGEN